MVTADFEERGVRYWIRYHTDDFERREVTDSLARDRIWYSLRRANIPMAIPVAELELHQDDETHRSAARTEATSVGSASEVAIPSRGRSSVIMRSDRP